MDQAANLRGAAGINVGHALTPSVKTATNLSTFLVGVAWWTTHRIHYDKDEAIREGFDDVVVPGVLRTAEQYSTTVAAG